MGGPFERQVSVNHDPGAGDVLARVGVLERPGRVGEVMQPRREARADERIRDLLEQPHLPLGGRARLEIRAGEVRANTLEIHLRRAPQRLHQRG